MSIGQTSYSMSMAIGRAGMYADGGNRDVESKNNQTPAAAVIPFGCAVVQGTNDNECKLPAATTDVTNQGSLLGVAVVDLSRENQRDSNPPSYDSGEMVAVLKKGRVYVTVEENVTPASPVFIRFATGAGGTQLGAFRASADTATAVQAPGWRYKSTATAGNVAVVELNLP